LAKNETEACLAVAGRPGAATGNLIAALRQGEKWRTIRADCTILLNFEWLAPIIFRSGALAVFWIGAEYGPLIAILQ
jgi:hypothetical protein